MKSPSEKTLGIDSLSIEILSRTIKKPFRIRSPRSKLTLVLRILLDDIYLKNNPLWKKTILEKTLSRIKLPLGENWDMALRKINSLRRILKKMHYQRKLSY